MKQFIRRFFLSILCLLALTGLCVAAAAQEFPAADLSQDTHIEAKGFDDIEFLTDGDTRYYRNSSGNATLVLEAPEPIGSLYLLFHDFYGPYTVTDNATGNTYTAGTNRYLHEYIDVAAVLGDSVTSVTLSFSDGYVLLGELYIFSHGQVPDFVQRWQPPLEGCTDILLFATHSDDDQLFFAGLFPQYGGQLGYGVQVAYMTDHRRDTWTRSHEVLNGLWATGVTHYPVFGDFDDFREDDMEKTYRKYKKQGVTEEDLLGFVVEQIRRFDPLVVVGHDFEGEYGHGMHMVYADLLAKAVHITADPTQFPRSAQTYGTWDVQKAYFHVYEENPIVLDYDQPLEAFDGLTAFQVTQQYGFPCHKSQLKYVGFMDWLYGYDRDITKVTEVEPYPPHKFGLYRSTVGPDIEKNDFMENIVSYGEQARLEQERLEQERLEAERLEAERLAQEKLEAERLEQERLEAQRLEAQRIEQQRLEAERLEQQRLEALARQRTLLIGGIVLGVVAAAILLILLILFKKKFRKNFEKA